MALRERYGKWQSVYSNLRRWTIKGVRHELFEQIKTWAPGFDVEYIMIDSIAVGRRKPAMGVKSGSKSIGRIAGGSATKIHLVFDSRIKPLEYIQKGAIHFDEICQTCCKVQFLCDVVLLRRFVENLGQSRKT